MTGLILLGVVIAVLLGLLALLKAKQGDASEPSSERPLPAFTAQKYLLTKAEREFHDVLQGIVGPSGLRLFVQVSLDRLVQLPRGMSGKGADSRKSWQNRIDRKTVDFVLCEPKLLTPLLAIELDDATHEREHRRQRDALVERILQTAGVPLLRWKVDPRGYKRDELHAAIKGAVPRLTVGPRQPAEVKVTPTL